MTHSPSGEMRVEEPKTSLRDILYVLHRRQWIIAGATVAALTVAVAASLLMAPVYRAATTVTTDKTPPVMLMDKPGEFNFSADQTAGEAPDMLTLAELVRSDAVREGAIVRLTPAVGHDAANRAVDGLTVQQVRQTELVRISVESNDPHVAAKAADAVADSLVDINLRTRRQRATATREFIGRELQEAGQRLHDAEDTLVAFHDQHGDISLNEETTLNLQKLADLRAQLVDVQLQRGTAESRVAAARQGLATQAKLTPTQWTPSPLIASLQDELAKQEIELSGLRRTFTARHPAVRSTTAKIDETKQRLDAEMAKSLRPGIYGVDPVYQQLSSELAQGELNLKTLSGREQAMHAAIAGYEERMRGVPVREVGLARLTRDVKESEQIYLLLSEKYEQARIAESSIGSVIRVVDSAKVPSSPVKPRRQMNTLFGGLLGLMIGIVGALLAEQLDDSVKSAEDVERVLGAPVLGTIPVERPTTSSGAPYAPREAPDGGKTEAGTLPLDVAAGDFGSATAEAYRALRTHVLFSMPDVEHKHLLVTSALPGEGKSTVVANLAVAVAHADRPVWVIDADMRRPTLWRWFGGEAAPGLANLLAGQTEPDNVVRSTAEPNLRSVSSGPTVLNPSELLGSQRMARLMDRARGETDLVLIDSPPLLTVTDAEVLAAHAVDGVLLVVKAGETNRRALAQVRKRLDRVGGRLVGAVLNFVHELHPDGYVYGAYYHAYQGTKDEHHYRGQTHSMGQEDEVRRGEA